MTGNTHDPHAAHKDARAKKAGGFLGSLRDALHAAGREDAEQDRGPKDGAGTHGRAAELLPPPQLRAAPPPNVGDLPPMKTIAPKAEPSVEAPPAPEPPAAAPTPPPSRKISAAEAAEAVRRQRIVEAEPAVEVDVPPTTAVVRKKARRQVSTEADGSAVDAQKTQLVRGQADVKRGAFERDPVVGWLVIVGGPGIGNFRPIHEGNNTLGRAETQRIPIDFGDTAISSEEQAYIRYDSSDRSFLFVPNLTKTNVVSVNDRRPTAAVSLQAMDVIAMGRTQLVFVPFCGQDFDWSELMKSAK